MIIEIDHLIDQLRTDIRQYDTTPSEALWIKFDQEKTDRTIEYRTADGNQIVHVYLDRRGNLVGIEIFP